MICFAVLYCELPYILLCTLLLKAVGFFCYAQTVNIVLICGLVPILTLDSLKTIAQEAIWVPARLRTFQVWLTGLRAFYSRA